MLDDLRDLYDNASMMTPGTTFTYRNYTLEKSGSANSPPVEHSEYMILNEEGTRVESFTIGAFESFNEFQYKLDELIDYAPSDIEDWLSRNDNN